MNSSEVKKIIWAINLVVVLGLGVVMYLVQQQLSKPTIVLKPFEYIEPPVTEKIGVVIGGVTRNEVETVFGYKLPVPPKPAEPVKPVAPVEVKPVVVVSNINNMFTLETIIGRLAFILVKKDKVIKSVIVGDDILNTDGEVLGTLKEVREDSVLILLKGNIETLYFEGLEEAKGGASVTTPTPNTNMKTALVPPVKTEGTPPPKEVVRKVEGSVAKKNDNNAVVDNSGVASPLPEGEDKTFNRQKSTFDGIEFEFYDTKDADGIVHRKIPEEMATKLQQKDVMKKFTSSDNYDLVFQANGVLIKNIKDPEIKKFFNAFGISDSDIILSVNGQSLGNKTEDDLINLYQQIIDTAKYATIELLKNNVRQKYRISTDRIKRAGKK